MQAILALNFSAATALVVPTPTHTQTRAPRYKILAVGRPLQAVKQRAAVHRWRAMATDPYVDYKSSAKSVFPAEACETVGGESCEGEMGSEVKPKPNSSSSPSPKSASQGVDREYVEYTENQKTVFPGEACDDLGGEFCEPEYQSGVYKEKEPAK